MPFASGHGRYPHEIGIEVLRPPQSVNLCSVGLFSNISWVAIGCTLLACGTVVVMRGFEPGAWLESVRRHRITHSAIVPVQFQRLFERHHFDDYDVTSLTSLMCCGSPLSAKPKGEIMQRSAGARPAAEPGSGRAFV